MEALKDMIQEELKTLQSLKDEEFQSQREQIFKRVENLYKITEQMDEKHNSQYAELKALISSSPSDTKEKNNTTDTTNVDNSDIKEKLDSLEKKLEMLVDNEDNKRDTTFDDNLGTPKHEILQNNPEDLKIISFVWTGFRGNIKKARITTKEGKSEYVETYNLRINPDDPKNEKYVSRAEKYYGDIANTMEFNSEEEKKRFVDTKVIALIDRYHEYEKASFQNTLSLRDVVNELFIKLAERLAILKDIVEDNQALLFDITSSEKIPYRKYPARQKPLEFADKSEKGRVEYAQKIYKKPSEIDSRTREAIEWIRKF